MRLRPPLPLQATRLLRLACVFAALFTVQIACKTQVQSEGGAASNSARNSNSYSLIEAASRKPAPDLSLPNIDGQQLSLSQYRGKVVLLDFWAVDCGGCVQEIPWYVEFDKKYRDKGLQPLGIDMYGESPSYIKAYMQKTQMQYPIAVGNDAIGERFHAQELPMTILIDRQGRIAVSHVGIVDKAAFEADIRQLLN
jgi:peroxiredoxin